MRDELLFQSTLPVGGATEAFETASVSIPISIHAPRGGSDTKESTDPVADLNFNPRSPWGERQYWRSCELLYWHFNPRSPWGERPGRIDITSMVTSFQSTLPVGGATPPGPRL